MQSELDSLKQRVVELLAENAEIKAENAKVKAENAKLRQAMEENETRLAKLEQSDKEKAKLIAELNCDVGKIKQERVVVDIATQPSTSNKSLEDRKTDEFLVSVSKKKVSDMMRQRNRESMSQHFHAEIRTSIQLLKILLIYPLKPMILWKPKPIKAIHNHWEKRYQRYPKKPRFPTII